MLLYFFYLFTINVKTETEIEVKVDTESEYVPTNIVNGSFDEVPWLAFMYEETTYTKKQLENFDYGKIVLAHGTGDDLFTEIEQTSGAKYTKDVVTNG